MLEIAFIPFGAAVAVLTWKVASVRSCAREARLIAQLDRSLADVGAGTFVAYTQSRELHCSRSTLNVIGSASPTGVLSFDDWVELVHPADRDKALEGLMAAETLGQHYSLDYRVRFEQPDRYVWLRTYSRPVRYLSDETVVHVAVLDISALKALELELSTRTAHFHGASVASGMYRWELDLQTMVYTFDRPLALTNPSGESISPVSKLSVDEFRHLHCPDDGSLLNTMLERIRSDAIPYEMEARVLHPDTLFHRMLAQRTIIDDGAARIARRASSWQI